MLAPYFDQVIGIDVSSTQIEEAKKSHASVANLDFKVGPAEVLPFEDNSVDLVSSLKSFKMST